MGAFYIFPRRKILQEVTENFAKYIGEFYKIHRKILQNTSENFTNMVIRYFWWVNSHQSIMGMNGKSNPPMQK